MSDSDDFLKYVINEDIYLIDYEPSGQKDDLEEEVKPVTKASTVNEQKAVLHETKVRSNNILVLFDNATREGMLQSEEDYLGKILRAIGKSLDKIDSQNVTEENPDYTGYQYVLCFTPNHKMPIPASTLQYEKVSFEGALIVVTDSLTDISSSTELRKKLWAVLQKVFPG